MSVELHKKPYIPTWMLFFISLGIAALAIFLEQRNIAQPVGVIRPVLEIRRYEVFGRDELSERAILRDEWLKAAKNVADLSNEADAQAVFAFLHEKGGLARPQGENLVLMQRPDVLPVLFIVPFKPEDECIGPWELFGDTHAPGALLQLLDGQSAYLALRSVNLSIFSRGVALLHEGYIARELLKNADQIPRNPTIANQNRSCDLDREAAVFQYNVTAKIGGSAYQAAVIAESKRLGALIGVNPNAVLPRHEPDLDTLEQALGPSASEVEKEFRRTHLWMNAVFRYLSNTDPAHAKARQAEFVCSLLTPSISL